VVRFRSICKWPLAGQLDDHCVGDRKDLADCQLGAGKRRSELHNKGWAYMASSSKKKTTMAKITRESRLRERRADKEARKNARKQAAADQADQPVDSLTAEIGETADPTIAAQEHAEN
jgi:hypothetical protein